MNPSGIRPPEDGKYTVREVKQGLFVVNNAYAGRYEFFKGRPAPSDLLQEEILNSPSEDTEPVSPRQS
jgi:hypothetical protein